MGAFGFALFSPFYLTDNGPQVKVTLSIIEIS